MARKYISRYSPGYGVQKKKSSLKKKARPPYRTFAENYYYLKQKNNKTLIVVVLINGETVNGHIEWFDKNYIKLNRHNVTNLLIHKDSIKYLYKLEESRNTGRLK